ncbi:hypothetical protein [Streptomyces sp. NPDC058268]|uniref:hypothetical protein n=1 Tax=Streptomyces sp. NPDC058268 TaxID=3346413 RepID=UPI0036EC79D9
MTTTPETPNFGVEQHDPAQPAPAVVIPNTHEMKSPGHGYTLPLVGRVRPHTFEAVLPEQNLRVFADRPADILAELIDGYGALEADLTQAIDAGDEETIAQREMAAFDARSQHATTVRQTLQQQFNAQAHEDGAWAKLDEEEQEQLTTAATGAVPTGVLFSAPAEDDLGNPVDEEIGEWSSTVPLALNRGEYIDGEVAEPGSGLETELPDGRKVVIAVEHPANLVHLDPIDPYTYLKSLERAGVITLMEREVVQMDELFTAVMDAGTAS